MVSVIENLRTLQSRGGVRAIFAPKIMSDAFLTEIMYRRTRILYIRMELSSVHCAIGRRTVENYKKIDISSVLL